MVHQSTLSTEFTGRWNCAITIQANTAVEIVFKKTASSVLPLEPFLQSFDLEMKIEKLFGIVACWLKIGCRLDHHFDHKSLHAYLHRNIFRNGEIHSFDWVSIPE